MTAQSSRLLVTFFHLCFLSFLVANVLTSETLTENRTCDLYYGGTCVAQCPASYERVRDRCYYNPPRPATSSASFRTATCTSDQVSMIFSWIAYEHDPSNMQGRQYNERVPGFRRFLGGCGDWTVRNGINYQRNTINTHVVFADNAERGIAIVAFRGTELDFSRLSAMATDWVFGNLALARTSFVPNCGSVHSGFLKFYQAVENDVLQQVARYFQKGYHVIFTGHSQGAALTTLAAVGTRTSYPQYANRIRLITFAPPRVGNQEFVNCFEKLIPTSHVTHYVAAIDSKAADWVPQLPPKLIGYRHISGKWMYVPCFKQFFGNPGHVPGMSLKGPSRVPDGVGCHYQEVYFEGMKHGARVGEPLADTPLDDALAYQFTKEKRYIQEEEEDLESILELADLLLM